MRTMLIGALCCLAIVAAAMATGNPGSAALDDRYWPSWRGPQLNGVAPLGNPPIEWSENDNVAWKVPVTGSGFASPIIWGDHIFLLSAIPADSGPDDHADVTAAAPHSARRSAGPTAADADTGDGDEPTLVASGSREPASQRRQRGNQRRGEPLASMDFTVIALDRADGSVRWSRVATRETPHEGKQVNNSWASGSAVTDGEKVFAFFGSRGLYTYDFDGNLLWDVDLGDMRIRNGFGEGSTPALYDDRLVIVWDHQGESFIVALDKDTGAELWRRQRDEPESWATPLIVDVAGRPQVVTAAQNRTRGYDLESGEIVWEGPGLTVNPIPSPVASNGIVYLMSGYRGNALRAVRLGEARGEIGGSEAVLWEYNQDTPYVPSPLLYEGRLFFLKSNNSILTAFDAERGEKLYGPQRLDGLQEIYASPVGAAGRVYIVDRDGGALVIDAGEEFRTLAINSLDDGFEASPAIVGDELYLRGRRFLYRIEQTTRPNVSR